MPQQHIKQTPGKAARNFTKNVSFQEESLNLDDRRASPSSTANHPNGLIDIPITIKTHPKLCRSTRDIFQCPSSSRPDSPKRRRQSCLVTLPGAEKWPMEIDSQLDHKFQPLEQNWWIPKRNWPYSSSTVEPSLFCQRSPSTYPSADAINLQIEHFCFLITTYHSYQSIFISSFQWKCSDFATNRLHRWTFHIHLGYFLCLSLLTSRYSSDIYFHSRSTNLSSSSKLSSGKRWAASTRIDCFQSCSAKRGDLISEIQVKNELHCLPMLLT